MPLHPLKHGKSRRGRIDLLAGRVLTSRYLQVSASPGRGPRQTTHLADRQLHRKALSFLHLTQEGGHQSRHHLLPFFNQGRSLQLIHHPQRHPAVAVDARTAVEQRRHHPLSNISKYELAAVHLLAPKNLGLGDVALALILFNCIHAAVNKPRHR